MNAICLVIDRLHAGYVGAYGNAWIDTPALDRLACEAVTFDHALVSCPGLDGLYRSIWQGHHPLAGPDAAESLPALADLLGESGVATTLLTDQSVVAEHPLARSFAEHVQIDPPDRSDPAEDVETTHLARCFAHLIDRLQSAGEPFLTWCHLSGMTGPWDAPYELRAGYAEPGDPPPPRSAHVPRLMLEEDFDPDRLLAVCQAYAGQVALLDTCIGALLELLDEGPVAENTLLVLLSARGFPLGEHQRVGAWDDALYGELVHVPMMIRFPDRTGAAARTQALVTPADLRPTLLDWWELVDHAPTISSKSLMPLARGETDSVRDRLCMAGADTERAIRTPAWYLRIAEQPELFAKPDDRWEANNVADRCCDVVEGLSEAAAEYEACLITGRLGELSPLSEILMTGLQ